jgi:hypothetical protein
MMGSGRSSRDEFGGSQYTSAMTAVVEEIKSIGQRLAQIETNHSPEELRELASSIARMPAMLEKLVDLVRDEWFHSNLNWRVQAPYVAAVVLDFAYLLQQFESNFDKLDSETASLAREAILQLQGMGIELRGLVNDRIKTERRSTESLRTNPEIESRFMKMHEQGKREIEEGRFEDYSLEEFKQQFG